MLDKGKVERFIKHAMKYKGDRYSQTKRMDTGYSDCSSIIYKGLRDADLLDTSQTTRTVSTRYMRDGDPRFRRIDMGQLERGDILWWQKQGVNYYSGHVGIYLGQGKVLEAIKSGVDIHPRSRLGWQRAYRIKALEATQTAPSVKPMTAKGQVTAGTLNVRNHDSTAGRIIGQIKRGAAVDITGRCQTGWYQIRHQGQTAYVSDKYIKLEAKRVRENVPIVINGAGAKTRAYIVDGTSYIEAKGPGPDIPVRSYFEKIGARVDFRDNTIFIRL